jgi:protein tyrosine phosphatase (PTP) superfamily phosphohydrolase (DUF442 family)
MGVESVQNYFPIDARLATGGQPSAADFEAVAAAGYAAVINLGLLDPKYCLPDEAGLMATLGLRYAHIPVPFHAPTPDHFEAFLSAMREFAAHRVFVHCALNYRASSFLALYGEIELEWSRERADQHARRFWDPDSVWLGFLEACRTRWGRGNPPLALPQCHGG